MPSSLLVGSVGAGVGARLDDGCIGGRVVRIGALL